MRQVLAINRALYRALRNRAVERLGDSISLYRVAMGTVLVCVALFQVVVYLAARTVTTAIGDDPSLTADYVGLTILAHVCVASLVSACLVVILAGAAETLGYLLRTLPISPPVGNLAGDLPVVLVSVAAAATSVPALFYTVAIAADVAAASLSATALVALVACASIVSIAVLRACERAMPPWVFRRREVGEVSGLLLLVAANVALFYYAVFHPYANPVREGLERYASALAASELATLWVALTAIVAASLLWVVTSRRPGPVVDLVTPSLIGMLLSAAGCGTLRPRKGRGRVHLEVVQLIRSPNVGMALTLMVLVLVVAFPLGSLMEVSPDAIILGIVVDLAIVISVSSYGVTWRHHWIFRVMEARQGSWVPYKWLGICLLLGTMVTVAAAAAVLVLSGNPPDVGLVTYGLLMLAIGMLVGAFLPADNRLVLLVDVLVAAVATFVVAFILVQVASGLPGLLASAVVLVAVYVVYRKAVVSREGTQPAL